jgi:plasmid maintenance system antidote protein VapI
VSCQMARIRYNDGMSDSLAERLKAAIAESCMKRSELARAADVEESALSRFVHGKRSISLDAASRLADVLNLELRPRRRRKGD